MISFPSTVLHYKGSTPISSLSAIIVSFIESSKNASRKQRCEESSALDVGFTQTNSGTEQDEPPRRDFGK